MAPLSFITAESFVIAFLFSWVARFGVPPVLTSDPGTQFTSSVCHSLGISLSTTTSFHPQSNGMIERFQAGSDWPLHLPLVLLGLRSVPKEDTGFSVSDAVFGSPLTVPGEFLEGGEIPPTRFLQKIEQAVSGFVVPPPHHISTAPRRHLFYQPF